MADKLTVRQKPTKTRYCDGESIDLNGIALDFDSKDVTDKVVFERVPNVEMWPRGCSRVYVRCSYAGESVTVELKRKTSPWAFIVAALVIACLAFGLGYWRLSYEPENLQAGSKIEAQGERDDSEVQSMLDERAAQSEMLVNIASTLELNDAGEVRVAFIVEDGEPAYAQRLELVQDNRTIFKSGTVLPGYAIEWARADGARVGEVNAMVYRVDEATGSDVGSPVAVELEIKDADREDG